MRVLQSVYGLVLVGHKVSLLLSVVIIDFVVETKKRHSECLHGQILRWKKPFEFESGWARYIFSVLGRQRFPRIVSHRSLVFCLSFHRRLVSSHVVHDLSLFRHLLSAILVSTVVVLQWYVEY